jgi:hypothetical protein
VIPVVSLDVLPADVPAEYAPVMVGACTEALANGRCAMASTLPESTQPEAVALVLWQGDGYLQVTVRVGRGGHQWVARALTFSERDSISERWTTVGLTVATLVGESRVLDTNAMPGGEPAPQTRPTSPAAVATPVTPQTPQTLELDPSPVAANGGGPASSWLASLGALTGPGWDGGGFQRGGWLSATFRVPRLSFQVQATGSYAVSHGPTVQHEELATRWMTAAIGAGVFGYWPTLALSASAELELAYRHVKVDFNGRSVSDQDVPVRARAFASVPATGLVAATFGMLVRLPPQNSHRSSGSFVASAAVSVEGLAGIEVRL